MAARGGAGLPEKPLKTFARDILWRLLNVVAAALWITAAAFRFVHGTFQSVMPGIALMLIGIVSVVLEFWRPEVILENCYFLWNFMGRGLFFLLMGCLVIETRVVSYVAAGLSWGIGLLYIVLWFTSFTLFPVASMSRRDLEAQAY
ncbi:hypothetical protein H4R18_003322 [Coemansia javaensis]|uniref:COPI associated n=1 Tax=Coemansia javaensis TaxID=2761396 RepID=A0A9W8HFS5_9FUNG|nr:hypothetical protein H4R18_003322 [Coemansia javaensis]